MSSFQNSSSKDRLLVIRMGSVVVLLLQEEVIK